jgi:hypothetical protein
LPPTNRQPSTICRSTDGVEVAASLWFVGMSLREKMMTAETRYASALMNRAR